MIANALTILRLFLSFPFVWLFINGYRDSAVAILFLAFTTDILDGYLARKLGSESKLGATLDPLSDKILYISVLSTLVYVKYISSIPAIIITIRELLITGLRGTILSKGIAIPAQRHGKLKTVFQSVAIFLIIFLQDSLYSQALAYASMAVTLYSGYRYAKNINIKLLNQILFQKV